MSSINDAKIPDIPTNRELRPTCSWCGSHESKNWIFILGRGKFYCSYDCRDAASYRIYIAASLASIVGFILLIVAFIFIENLEVREFTQYFGLLLLIGSVGSIFLTRNAMEARNRVKKNSKNISKP